MIIVKTSYLHLNTALDYFHDHFTELLHEKINIIVTFIIDLI